MGRALDTATLDGAARHLAAAFLRQDRSHQGRFTDGPAYVAQELFAATFKDEHEHLLAGVREWLSARALKEFERLAASTFTPREDRVFHQLLADKLAIDRDGAHLAGKIGTTQIGARRVGDHFIDVESPDSLKYRKRLGLDKTVPREFIVKHVPLVWPVYAGEDAERAADSGVADALPQAHRGAGATNTRISNEVAILACDAIVDNLDEGSDAAVIQGRTGTQPTDPDTTVSGTLLFTLVCSDPAFGAAADAAPGATATASSVSSDASADATGTLGYCRASATNDGATPLDDHLDGEAGTSGADFNFNTLSIVSGSTVSLSSWTVTMPES